MLVAYDNLFGPTGSSRRGVQKLAVVLTDGKQTSASDVFALDKVIIYAHKYYIISISIHYLSAN